MGGVLKEREEQVEVEKPPHMPENGYDEDLDALPKKEKKKANKCLKNHRKAMCEFELAVDSNTLSSNIEATIVLDKFPFGRLCLVLAGMYRVYRGVSMLDHVQLDKDKLTIRMTANAHPNVLFERMFAVKRQYVHRGNGPNTIKPSMPQLIACVVNGASRDYSVALTTEFNRVVVITK